MGNKLRIGIFGGYRGYTMIDVLLNHQDAELVAVCDMYEPILERVTEQSKILGLNVKCFKSFDEFIKYDMDAVVLANYATEHATFAVRCLNAGKHVLSEVLPCETIAQAIELIEAVEKTGLVYAYAENYCYMRHSFEMWRRYKAGEIGEVQYIEGEYVHDCSKIWPQITYGDPDHWRNRMYPTYYCTHSIGPMIAITGRRPVQVVGFETPLPSNYSDSGITRGAGLEIITLDNGAVARSLHGDLRREPSSYNYMIYGQKGMMEGERFPKDSRPLMHYYHEDDPYKSGTWDEYDPEAFIAPELANKFGTHGGSDFYATHFFIEKILGRPDGDWAIDVYTAVDMGICGILAYKSILQGNVPVKVPNFRNKDERDAYRGDNACTTPAVAGDQLLPRSSHPYTPVSAETYEHHKDIWQGNPKAIQYGREFTVKDKDKEADDTNADDNK